MRDMFFEYDNNIDNKREEHLFPKFTQTRTLESSPSSSLVVDLKGNELGICVKKSTPTSLFFILDGCVEGSSVEELVKNSSINFQLIDYWHEVIIDKTLSAESAYVCDDNIKIDLTSSDMNKLKQETYYIKLTLFWPDGYYILFAEENGFLTIK